jgi:hypothetical protein
MNRLCIPGAVATLLQIGVFCIFRHSNRRAMQLPSCGDDQKPRIRLVPPVGGTNLKQNQSKSNSSPKSDFFFFCA